MRSQLSWESVCLTSRGSGVQVSHAAPIQPTDKAQAYETGRWDACGRVCVINRSRVDGTKPAGLTLSRKGYREDCGTSYYIWAHSSIGRAPALQAGGCGFDSHWVHQRPQACVIKAQTAKRDSEYSPIGRTFPFHGKIFGSSPNVCK